MRNILWCLAVTLGLTFLLLHGAQTARADSGDGTFTLNMAGQIAASQNQGTDPQGNRTIAITQDLHSDAGSYPAVTLALVVTERVNAKGSGTLTGTATLSDLSQQQSLFSANVSGTIATANSITTVTYRLQNAQAATGSGGMLIWSGVWRSSKQGATTANAQGTLQFPSGLAAATRNAIWPGSVTVGAATIDPTLWYLTRGAASAAYILLAVTTALGIGISTRAFDSVTQRWRVLDLHQVLTLTMVALVILHLVTLVLDPFISFSVVNLLWPLGEPYSQLAVACGVLGFYALVVVTLSSWLRQFFSYRVWHVLHYVSFIGFVLLTLHGILGGTDTTTPWMLALYITSVLAIGLLTIVRLIQTAQSIGQRQPAAQS